MVSSSSGEGQLPWPSQWGRPQRLKYMFVAAFFAFFGCVGVAAGVSIFLPWDSAISVTAGELDGQLITVAADENAAPQFHRRTRMWKQSELKLAPHMAIRGCVSPSTQPWLSIRCATTSISPVRGRNSPPRWA